MWQEVDPADYKKLHNHCELMRKQTPKELWIGLCTPETLAAQLEEHRLRAFVYQTEVDYIGFGIDYSQTRSAYFVTGIAFDVEDPVQACYLIVKQLVDMVPKASTVFITRPITDLPIESAALWEYLDDGVLLFNRLHPDRAVDCKLTASHYDDSWEVIT